MRRIDNPISIIVVGLLLSFLALGITQYFRSKVIVVAEKVVIVPKEVVIVPKEKIVIIPK